MKTERELFLEWHFLDWKLHNAVTDTVDFSKVLYDRVYSHDHTSSVREVEFKAWTASSSREGYKLVPVEPTYKQLDALKNSCELFKKAGVSDLEAHGAYKAMIGENE